MDLERAPQLDIPRISNRWQSICHFTYFSLILMVGAAQSSHTQEYDRGPNNLFWLHELPGMSLYFYNLVVLKAGMVSAMLMLSVLHVLMLQSQKCNICYMSAGLVIMSVILIKLFQIWSCWCSILFQIGCSGWNIAEKKIETQQAASKSATCPREHHHRPRCNSRGWDQTSQHRFVSFLKGLKKIRALFLVLQMDLL